MSLLVIPSTVWITSITTGETIAVVWPCMTATRNQTNAIVSPYIGADTTWCTPTTSCAVNSFDNYFGRLFVAEHVIDEEDYVMRGDI